MKARLILVLLLVACSARADGLGSAPKGPVREWLQRKVNRTKILWRGVPAAAARVWSERAGAGKQRVEALLASPDEVLRVASVEQLAEAGRMLMRSSPAKATRSEDLFRVLTAHGTQPAQIDAVVARLGYRANVLSSLAPREKSALLLLQKHNEVRPGDWRSLARYVRTLSGARGKRGSSVELLIDGEQAFGALFRDVDAAKSSIIESRFVFKSDTTGWAYAKKLAAAARRGVSVTVLYDPLGSEVSERGPDDRKLRVTDPAMFAFLREAGAKVVELRGGAFASQLSHRKLTIVDGNVAHGGGMNVADEYRYDWHDVNYRATGPAVADLARIAIDQARAAGVTLDPAIALRPAKVTAASGRTWVINHVGQKDQNHKQILVRAIRTALTKIEISNPYFTDADIIEELKSAARRGVEVTLMLPGESDAPRPKHAAAASYPDMLAAGIRIFEHQGRIAHGKVMLFDGALGVAGSTNADARSFWNNHEEVIVSTDPGMVHALRERVFAVDLKRAKEIRAYTPTAKDKLWGWDPLRNQL